MNYNLDIPFERRPTAGFYDTMEELNRPDVAPDFSKIDLNKIERPKRHQLEEEKRKKDFMKAKETPLPIKELKQIQNKEEDISKRRKMILPLPQVQDSELQNVIYFLFFRL